MPPDRRPKWPLRAPPNNASIRTLSGGTAAPTQVSGVLAGALGRYDDRNTMARPKFTSCTSAVHVSFNRVVRRFVYLLPVSRDGLQRRETRFHTAVAVPATTAVRAMPRMSP